MTQNTFTPSDFSQYDVVVTEAGSLVAPFNPDKVAELVNTAMVTFGGIPPIGYLGCGPDDTLIEVYPPKPNTAQHLADLLGAINAVCIDPTRNDLTEQQADLQYIQDNAEDIIDTFDTILADIETNIDALGTIINDTAAANTVNQIKANLQDPLSIQQANANMMKGLAENQKRILAALRWIIPPTE